MVLSLKGSTTMFWLIIWETPCNRHSAGTPLADTVFSAHSLEVSECDDLDLLQSASKFTATALAFFRVLSSS